MCACACLVPSCTCRFKKDTIEPFSVLRRDPEGIFSEPVTDDIAPGYSTIISHPLDLKTILKKIETNLYSSVNEFRVILHNDCTCRSFASALHIGPTHTYIHCGTSTHDGVLEPVCDEAALHPMSIIQDTHTLTLTYSCISRKPYAYMI